MSLDELKEGIIKFIKSSYQKNGKAPTIKRIVDSIEGVNNSNFYIIFPDGIRQACGEANVEVPHKRIERTKFAVNSRREPKKEPRRIQLDEGTFEDVNRISFIEKISEDEVIRRLVENDRVLRRDYDLSFEDSSKFSSFLKSCRENGLEDDRVFKTLWKFIDLDMDKLPHHLLTRLIILRNDMLKNGWNFSHIQAIYTDRKESYKEGYNYCLENVRDVILEEMKKQYAFNSIGELDKLSLCASVLTSLTMKTILF